VPKEENNPESGQKTGKSDALKFDSKFYFISPQFKLILFLSSFADRTVPFEHKKNGSISNLQIMAFNEVRQNFFNSY